MIRVTSKTIAASVLMLSVAACGQAPAGTGAERQQVPVSTTATPSTLEETPIGRDRAVEIALNQTGGGSVDEVENEVEHGRTAWKVRVVKDGIRYSVYIDKANGEIIRFRNG